MIAESSVRLSVTLDEPILDSQRLYLVGNVPLLPQWTLCKSLVLSAETESENLEQRATSRNYTLDLALPAGFELRYKYILVEEKRSGNERLTVVQRWLPGDVVRTVTVPTEGLALLKIQDQFVANYQRLLTSRQVPLNAYSLQVTFAPRQFELPPSTPSTESRSASNPNGASRATKTNLRGFSLFSSPLVETAEYSLEVESLSEPNGAVIIEQALPDASGSFVVTAFAKSLSQLDLSISIYQRQPGNVEKSRVGRAVLLHSQVEKQRHEDLSLPVFGDNLIPVGTLACHFLLTSPWSHPLNTLERIVEASWEPGVDIIGHRGMGKTAYTFVVENTMLSFNTAAQYGIKFIEFDVHLTTDNVPVIYHDFKIPASFNATGDLEKLDLALMDYAKFKSISPMLANGLSQMNSRNAYSRESPKPKRKNGAKANNKQQAMNDYLPVKPQVLVNNVARVPPIVNTNIPPPIPTTAHSGITSSEPGRKSLLHLMASSSEIKIVPVAPPKRTKRFSSYLPSTPPLQSEDEFERVHSAFPNPSNPVTWKLTDPTFPSLAEMLDDLPLDLGFNVEIKYPDQSELTSTFARDRNQLVDSILAVIFEKGRSRPLYFSSFDPEICILLQRKQSQYSVFFLVESHAVSHRGGRLDYDHRCRDLASALEFANAMNFRGLVCRADMCEFPENAEVIRNLRGAGKLLFTYGHENCFLEKVNSQRSLGVHGFITDSYTDILPRSEIRTNA